MTIVYCIAIGTEMSDDGWDYYKVQVTIRWDPGHSGLIPDIGSYIVSRCSLLRNSCTEKAPDMVTESDE